MSIPSLNFPVDLNRSYLRCYVHVAASGLVWVLVGWLTAASQQSSLLVLACAFVYSLVSWYAFARTWVMRKRKLSVQVAQGEVVLPSLWSLAGERRIALERVVAIQPSYAGLSIGVRNGLLAQVRKDWFAGAGDFERFAEVLQLRTRAAVGLRTHAKTSHGLLVAVVLLLLGLHLLRVVGAEDLSGLSHLHWGALNYGLVHSGEWFRLVTASLVHVNSLHLFANLILIIMLLPELRQRIGSAATIWVLFTGAVVGALASLSTQAELVVGASGAAYALLGGVLWLWFVDRQHPPVVVQIVPPSLLIAAVVLDFLLGLLIPVIAVSMHVAGLLAGAATTALALNLARRGRVALLGLGWGSLVLSMLAIVQWLMTDSLDSARRLLLRDEVSIGDANLGAWWIATEPNASDERLFEARDRLRRRADALVSMPPEYRDTLATLFYRTGDANTAVTLESQVLDERADEVVYASQLARFELALPSPQLSEVVSLELGAKDLCVSTSVTQRLDMDLLLRKSQQTLGLWRWRNLADGSCAALPVVISNEEELLLMRVTHSTAADAAFSSRWYEAAPWVFALP